MDNQNNQTPPNNLSNPNSFGASPPPLPDFNTPVSNFPSQTSPSNNQPIPSPTPSWPPPPQSPLLTTEPVTNWTPTTKPASQPTIEPSSMSNTWPSVSSANISTPTPQATFDAPSLQTSNSSFASPASIAPQPEPVNPASVPNWPATPQPGITDTLIQAAPTYTTPPATPEPIEITSNTNPTENNASQATLSPLDNPWGAPAQPPSIDGSGSPIQPSWMGASPTTPNSTTPNPPPNQYPNTTGPITAESAPTDLSHLINNNLQPTPTQAESVLVPAPAIPEVPTVPAETHKGLPKWLIGVGVGLLILVLAASAYFILGVGQPTKTTASLPATIATQDTEPAPAAPTAAPATQPRTQSAASSPTNTAGTTSFGQLQGEENPTTATSAADLLRQRQQGR